LGNYIMTMEMALNKLRKRQPRIIKSTVI